MILADRRDRKARPVPTATTALPDRLAWMGLKAPKDRREMRGRPVPQARKGHRVPMVRLDRKARPEPMGSREGLQARKVRLDRMARKVRRGK